MIHQVNIIDLLFNSVFLFGIYSILKSTIKVVGLFMNEYKYLNTYSIKETEGNIAGSENPLCRLNNAALAKLALVRAAGCIMEVGWKILLMCVCKLC